MRYLRHWEKYSKGDLVNEKKLMAPTRLMAVTRLMAAMAAGE